MMAQSDDWLDPSAARAQRREAKAARARQAQEDSVVQSIMSGPAGRAWMLGILETCQVFYTTFTNDPHGRKDAFGEGRRSIGLRLLAGIMQACPEAYIQMMRESSDGRGDHDRADPDDDRNYDTAGRWIGEGSDDSSE